MSKQTAMLALTFILFIYASGSAADVTMPVLHIQKRRKFP